MPDQKPVIRRTLFIGLGGTGVLTLLQVKKRFFEVYGHYKENHKEPDFVKFLAIDTHGKDLRDAATNAYNAYAGGAYGRRMEEMKGKEMEVRFDNTEMFPAEAVGSRGMILENKKAFDWIPDNEDIIRKMDDLKSGAGQTRLFGRVGFYWNAKRIRERIDETISEIMRGDVQEKDFSFDDANEYNLDVVIVASIAGGTGSGMFMDMGLMVKDICQNNNYGGNLKARTRGFFVLPDVFMSMANRKPGTFKNVRPNAAGALMEMDLFETFIDKRGLEFAGGMSRMSQLWDPTRSPLQERKMYRQERSTYDGPIQIQYLNNTVTNVVGRPFDQVYLIGASNDEGMAFTDVKHLASSISKALFTNVTAIAGSIEGLDNNARDAVADFQGKKSWVRSIGVSEMIHNPYEVRKHLSYRMGRIVAEHALNPGADTTWAVKAAKDIFKQNRIWEDGAGVDLFRNAARENVTVPLVQCTTDDVENGHWQKSGGSAQTADRRRVELEQTVLIPNVDRMNKALKSAFDGLDGLIPEGVGVVGGRKVLLDMMLIRLRSACNAMEGEQERLNQRYGQALDQVTTAEGQVKKFKGENNLIMRKLKAGEFKTKVGRWTRAVSDRIQCELNRKVMEEGLALLATAVQDLEGRQRKCIEEERRMSDLSKSLLEEVERREDADIASEFPNPFQINAHVDDMEIPLDFQTIVDSGEDWPGRVSRVIEGLNSLLAQVEEDWASDWWRTMDKDTLIEVISGLNLSQLALDTDGLSATLRKEFRAIEDATDPRSVPFLDTMNKLVMRSEPLLDWGDFNSMADGNTDFQSSLQRLFVITVPDSELVKGMEAVLPQLDALKNNKYMVVSAPDQADRVTVYRREVAAPAIAVNSVAGYMKEYEARESVNENSGELFHVNYHWKRAMDEHQWSLESGSSHSEDNAQRLFAWGFIMGWIYFDKDSKSWNVWNPTSNRYETHDQSSVHRHDLFEKLMMEGDGVTWMQSLLDSKMSQMSTIVERFDAIMEPVLGPNGEVMGQSIDGYWKKVERNPYAGSIPKNPRTGTNSMYGVEYSSAKEGASRVSQLIKEVNLIEGMLRDEVDTMRHQLR
jgi:hypothetical protein